MGEISSFTIDLNTFYETLAANFGLITRNRAEKRDIETGPGIFTMTIPSIDPNKNTLKIGFKECNINNKFIDNAFGLTESSEVNDLSDIYAYFGQMLALYTFYCNFNVSEYPNLKDSFIEVKTAVKVLSRAIRKADESGAYFTSLNDQELEDDKEKDNDFRNSLAISANFEGEIEKMYSYLEANGTKITTQRIISMSYLAMYYTLLGLVPRIFNRTHMSLRYFLEVCATKNGAISYIENILTDESGVEDETRKKIMGLLHTFAELSEFYMINCPVFRLKKDDLSNTNLIFRAIVNLGKCIKDLPPEEKFDKYREIYGELLNNTIFEADVQLGEVLNPINYIVPKDRETLKNDTSAIAILGYDLHTLIMDNTGNNVDAWNNEDYDFCGTNSMYLNIKKFEYSGFLDRIHTDEIEDYILSDLSAERNSTMNPESITRLLYFAAVSRYLLSENNKDIEFSDEIGDRLYSILIHSECLVNRMYSEWFTRKDRVYRTVDRVTVIRDEKLKDIYRQLRKECDFVLLNYIDFVCSLDADIQIKKGNGAHDQMQNAAAARREMNNLYYHYLAKTTVKMTRNNDFANTSVYFIEDSNNVDIAEYHWAKTYLNNSITILSRLFATNSNGDEENVNKFFISMVNKASNDHESMANMKNFLSSLKITRKGIVDIPLYNVIVSNYRKIKDSNLKEYERYMLIWGLTSYFIQKAFDSTVLEGTDMSNIILKPGMEKQEPEEMKESMESYIRGFIEYDLKTRKRGFYGKLL